MPLYLPPQSPPATAMPAAPRTGDRVFRTDQGREYFYDGTRWRTTQTFFGGMTATLNMSAINSGNRFRPLTAGQDIWITNWDLSVGVFSTNNGSNYWTFTLDKRASDDAATTIATLNTSAIAGGAWAHFNDAIGAVVDTNGANFNFIIQCSVKTGTPSNIQMTGGFDYQLIGT